MATQTGIGFSKILILAGAGYTSTILLKNGKLSDLLGDLQALVKGFEKKQRELSNDESDYSDAVAAQVRRLAMEVRQLASAGQITIFNGTSGKIGNLTSLVVPAASMGAMGYAYMWWKGLSLSDLMYVTKRNMANAVSNLTKHLENLSNTLAATKRYLTQRIEKLDGKLDEQVEISKLIRNEVSDVHGDLSQLGCDLDALRKMVSGLDGKIMSLEDKQDLTNDGVWYLCNFVNGRTTKMPERLQKYLEHVDKSNGYLTYEPPSIKGLKEIADSLASENERRPITDGDIQDIAKFNHPPKSLMRKISIKC